MKNISLNKILMAFTLAFFSIACSEVERSNNSGVDNSQVLQDMLSDQIADSSPDNNPNSFVINGPGSNASPSTVLSMIQDPNSFSYVATSGDNGAANSILSLHPEAQLSLLGESYDPSSLSKASVGFIDCARCSGGNQYALVLVYTLNGQTKRVIKVNNNANYTSESFEMNLSGLVLESRDLSDTYENELGSSVHFRIYNRYNELVGQLPFLYSN